ncbi:thymidylate synthase [Candidatus Uhrbacteria bacterium RIFCSPHIGHO2_12_FULL_60_25]|uniref:Thymidylate synthase n=1 Tax=Candidatus Uhrbacteria bacterium RIFCSPHIGHO2_12_FULL_60_25 TaxID=1802399 RepID=A0A1F7UPN6_9BACT|nr:MAG: thymidylate synthase [Candidatus Uhrbacteria bacterium RIFCSPHIGHO2_02_FULL_60_44]OGL79667.1 MAG: thymidylate synthase [Candidatus Uhrbacteria bacterium RIFCSPHIGHO2_12_FULL_60_25]
MKAYLDIVRRILDHGERKENRTGVDAITVAGAMFEHDMANGFPLLTTKKMPFKTIRVELEFFIKGLTDKKWLQDRRCTIWNEWANPKKAPYGHDEASKKRMAEERDLGPVYGFQWRHFDAPYENWDTDYAEKGIDQLKTVVDRLKSNPNDRRMIVMAWNPKALPEQALPPCHYGFQVTVVNGKLNLLWNQRSVDTMLGLPFNIASYAVLLHLLAKESGLKEGRLIGFLADTHIYVNHVDGAKQQLARTPETLPRIVTDPFTSIYDWTGEHTRLEGYEPQDKIEFPIAV